MRDRHDHAEYDRVPRRPSRANEIGGHDGLSMAGLQGMEGAKADRDGEGQDNDARAQLLRPHQVRERVPRSGLRVRFQPEGGFAGGRIGVGGGWLGLPGRARCDSLA